MAAFPVAAIGVAPISTPVLVAIALTMFTTYLITSHKYEQVINILADKYDLSEKENKKLRKKLRKILEKANRLFG